jgi:hypothetical protein
MAMSGRDKRGSEVPPRMEGVPGLTPLRRGVPIYAEMMTFSACVSAARANVS